jgi:hypothetical protein
MSKRIIAGNAISFFILVRCYYDLTRRQNSTCSHRNPLKNMILKEKKEAIAVASARITDDRLFTR